LVDKGWKVFAYDAIGCGESDGDSVLGFAQSPLDVHRAVQFARESGMDGGLPVLLMGHSWGGYGVAGALDFDDGVTACVSMSGFDTPEDIIIGSARASMGDIALTQIPFIRLIGWLDFGGSGNRSAAQAVSNARIPVLVVHGTQDSTVSFDAASIIVERESISNPNVRYLVRDEDGRNGHNDYFYSRESQAYLQECNDALASLKAEYHGEIPSDVLREFMDGIDKRRANTADPFLIDEIDSFFAAAVESAR
jgi:pimeloyl-ACP methyl ester carboxylesterase